MQAELSKTERSQLWAMGLSVLAWTLGGCAWSADLEAGAVFRLGACTIGMLTTLPALLTLYLGDGQRRGAEVGLLLAGAAALGSLGVAQVGSAEPWRLALAWLLPSALLLTAVGALLAPSFSAVLARLEPRPLPG